MQLYTGGANLWQSMNIYTDARPFYGHLHRCHADLAGSKNNKSIYNPLWLYGLYVALDRMS